LPDLFDEFFIDLTNIGAGPDAEQNKAQLIEHFENILQGNEEALSQLNDMITVSTNAQYRQGL
jgi:putative protease